MQAYNPSTFMKDSYNMYGNQQNDYEYRSGKVIDSAFTDLLNTPKNQSDLEDLFFQLMDVFGNERHQIAIDHKSDYCHDFGHRRDIAPHHEIYHTQLDGVSYKQYNSPIISLISEQIKVENKRVVPSKIKEGKVVESTKSRKVYEEILGKKSVLETEVLDGAALGELGWSVEASLKEYPKEFPFALVEKEGNLTDNELQAKKEAMKNVKSKYPHFYRRIKMNPILLELQKAYPRGDGDENKKSMFIVATARLEIDGLKYATSQYLTWLFEDLKTDTQQRMKKHSKVFVIHQDNHLVAAMLKDASKIFAEAILCEKSNFQELKNKVALFRYIFAHAMPYERGSAAIAEWFEHLIYRYHGVNFKYKEGISIDMEALTTPSLPEYIKKYDSFFEYIN